jgi:hypothetical protein
LIIIIYCISGTTYAISSDKISYIYGDYIPILSSQDDKSYLNFFQNNTDNINISKIYFWVKKNPNISCGYVNYSLSAYGDFLFMHSICTYVGEKRYENDLGNEISSLGPYQVRNNMEKVELVIQRNYGSTIPFPSISLFNISLNGLNFLNDTPYLSADEDRETIRQYMRDAGSVVTITEGKNLAYIISLSEGKKLELLEGTYQGPIDMRRIDNVSLEGVPEATIVGVPDKPIIAWRDSNKVSMSNLFFRNSMCGIFLENCAYFDISNIRINNFGRHNALVLKNANNNQFRDMCIYSNEDNTTGIFMINSSNNKLSNNNIQVENALHYLQNDSNDNIIYDGNMGKISDNGEIIDENGGTNNNCSEMIISNANNTWYRGDLNPCY